MISLAITGGLYLFNDEIDASLFRYRNYVEVADTALAPSQIVEKAIAAVPGATLASYRTPAGPDRLGGRYADPKTTPLRAEVGPRDNQLDPFVVR